VPLAIAIAVGVGRYYGHPRPATDEIRLSGRIEGYETDLAAKVGGRVVQIGVAEGDRVESGEVVAQLEDAQIQAQVGALVVVALTFALTGHRQPLQLNRPY
jgi:HlyD family secretion protein